MLVFLEHDGSTVSAGSLGVLSRAAALGGDDVAAVLIGAGPLGELAADAGKFGATTVFVAEDGSFDPPLPQPRVDVLEEVVRTGGHDTVLFSNSVLAADIAAALAVRLDAGLNWDLVDLVDQDGALVGKQPAFRDSVLADVGWTSPQRLALFRAGSFQPTPTGGDARIEKVTTSPRAHSAAAKTVAQTPRETTGGSIESADVIVGGGVGLGSEEGFAMAEELAALLNGAVGATRAAVYKGWYPHSTQIGQTGKTVAPKLYLALGISGAVQHKVGMQNSKTIIAVNKDPHAPIFEFSDLAVVGDVQTVVPELLELLRKHAG
jgi:electron transfer flavoprotein alpha subunit